jgi:hypothetical protein
VAAVRYTFTHKQYTVKQINNFGWKTFWDYMRAEADRERKRERYREGERAVKFPQSTN